MRWLALREPEARDRAAFIELLASHTHLGGSRPRDELEREMPVVPASGGPGVSSSKGWSPSSKFDDR